MTISESISNRSWKLPDPRKTYLSDKKMGWGQEVYSIATLWVLDNGFAENIMKSVLAMGGGVAKSTWKQGGSQCTQKMAAKCWVASFRWQQGRSRYEGLAILRKCSTFGFLTLHPNGSAWADNTHVETHQINNHPLAFGILLSGNLYSTVWHHPCNEPNTVAGRGSDAWSGRQRNVVFV